MKMMLVYIGILSALLIHPVATVEKSTAHYPIASRLTPLKLLRHHQIKQGTVCWYPLEVKCIDNVCGEPEHSYWQVSVNGNIRNYNANSTVKRSDVVRWHYVSLIGR